jgi:hypothetical protein
MKQHVRMAFNYSKKASEIIPTDSKIKEFFNDMKDLWQQVSDEDKPKQQEEETKVAAEPTAGEKKGLKRIIIDDPEEKKQQQE